MDVNIGLIRDRQGIYSGLEQSKSMNRQLAICYNSGGQLIVKIAVVKDIIMGNEGTMIVLGSTDHPPNEATILLDNIQSIYLISDFQT